MTYPTLEHAYQAAKTLDASQRELIRLAPTPGIAKRLGNKVTLREDWNSLRLDVMRSLLRRKFFPGSELAQKLVDTGQADLIEVNDWQDFFWGKCNGRGDNHLGRLLMQLRWDLSMWKPGDEWILNMEEVLPHAT